jgi:hypothetical protein
MDNTKICIEENEKMSRQVFISKTGKLITLGIGSSILLLASNTAHAATGDCEDCGHDPVNPAHVPCATCNAPPGEPCIYWDAICTQFWLHEPEA